MALLDDIANVISTLADGDLFYVAEDLTGSYQDGRATALVIKNYVLTGPLAVIGSASAGASIRLPEDTDNGSNYVAIKAPDNLAGTYTLTLPADDGASGEVLSTDGSGVLSWIAGGSAIAPLVVADANTIQQRNSTTAQVFQTYNTYTDASNYERLSLGWAANVLTLQTQKAGTGANRDLALNATGNLLTKKTLICDFDDGSMQIGLGGGTSTGFATSGGRVSMVGGGLIVSTTTASNTGVRFTPTGSNDLIKLSQGDNASNPAAFQFNAFTVSALPAAATYPYAMAFVSDATATTRLSSVSGGGSNKVMVWSDGTNWLIQ